MKCRIQGRHFTQNRNLKWEGIIMGNATTVLVGKSQLAAVFGGLALVLGVDAGQVSEGAPTPQRPCSPVALAPHVAKALSEHKVQFKAPFPNSANQGRKFNPRGDNILPLVTAAEQKVLVLFVEFTDDPPGGPSTRLPLSYFDDMLFGATYDPPEYNHTGPTDRTLYNYYKEVSYGKVTVVTLNMPSALGWANCGHPYSYYCNHDNGLGAYPNNAQGLVIDTITAVDSVVDFSRYAVNGELPNLFVVHTGTGAEWSATPDIIWSHSWNLSEGTGLDGFWVDGVKVNNYAMMPEVGGDTTGVWGQPTGPFPPTVGVYAHEYGHVLGLPDQYDYGYESAGTGNYSLMAGGSWNVFPLNLMFLGNSPSQLDAWSKYRLGFLTPIEVTAATEAVLPAVEREPVVYRMTVPNSGGKEYFLLENRQPIGFDQGLWSWDATGFQFIHGLAIWHIDDTVLNRNYWRCNEAENWKEFRSEGWRKAWTGESHYAISLMQADGLWALEHGWSGGFAANLYPGPLGVTEFGNFTHPNSSSYYFWAGSAPRFGYSGIHVSNIEEAHSVITAQVGFDPVIPTTKR